MKTLGSLLLVSALLGPWPANAMNFVVAQSDPHPRPQVIGDLVAVSPTELVVATSSGRVPLLMDSRTLVPTDLSVGNTLAVEFRVLENGSYYASRVVPFRGAVPTYGSGTTSAYDTHESVREPVAVSETHTTSTPATTAAERAAQRDEAQAESYPPTNASAGEPVAVAVTGADELPRTASRRPLLGVAGLAALAAAGTIMAVRRRRLV
jgi:hypothetical protein